MSNVSTPNDHTWVKQAFFYKNNAIENMESTANGRRYNSAKLKYTDTTLGGNFSINPKPQFTRWADLKAKSITRSSHGMGEYYSEAIDDNAQRIFLQFGVPEYNSLTRFFGNFYDSDSGRLVNTGDSGDFIYGLGKLAGYLFTAPIQPLLGIVNLWTRAVSMLAGKPYSKYYYLKPTMPLYWDTVSHMVNMIAVGMGVTEPADVGNVKDFTEKNIDAFKKKGLSYAKAYTDDQVSVINSMLPDVMRSDGGIDIYKVATRAQRLANKHEEAMRLLAKRSEGKDFDAYEKELLAYLDKAMEPDTGPQLGKGDSSFHGYLNNYYAAGAIGSGVGAENKVVDVAADGSVTGTRNDASQDKAAAAGAANAALAPVRLWDSSADYFTAGLQDGGQFISFIVDHEGSVSESFSNTAKSSDVESMMNGASSKGRAMNFNLAGGNLGDGMLAGVVEGFMGSVKSFLSGAADAVSMSGLSAVGGNAYVDIPDFWENASATLPKTTYTCRLSSPYGNKVSILTNIYVPLAMLLAGTLPRSTGKASYSSPFLVRLHSKGKNIVRLGIIDNLSITRGVGGVGWSVDGLPTAVDVSFSILNLDKVLHVPVTEQAGLSDLLSFSMMDEDSVFTDYMNVLGGVDLYSQLYAVPKLRLAWKRQLADFASWKEPSRWASHFTGSGAGRMLSVIYRGASGLQ